MDDGLTTIITNKYPKFKHSDGADALSCLGAWTSLHTHRQMYIVDPDIDNAVEDYAKRKERVVLMSSSPNSYMDRYIRDHFSGNNEKDPYLKWFDTVSDDDCTCTAAGLKWKKQMTEASQLGTAELIEKSDGLFVKVDYSNLPNMNKSILNQRFGLLGSIPGDFDGDVLQYCQSDVDTTVELYKQLEKETRKLMKKITDTNGSKMEAEPFRAMAWLAIKKVIFNNEATIVIWNDDEKTIVKCQEGEEFDKEKGLAMAICKRALGNTPYFNNYFKKWISEATVETPKKKKSKGKKVEETTETLTHDDEPDMMGSGAGNVADSYPDGGF